MLQLAELRVPERDAYYRYAALRGPRFAISIIASSGLATDWGMQSKFVEYIGRQKRSQLSILLAGRGYVGAEANAALLGPGDLLELDQARQDAEGYGGAPCEVLVIDWDERGPFGPARRGPPRISRLSPSDLADLRALIARVTTTEQSMWTRALIQKLGALGLPVARNAEPNRVGTTHAARLYGALGATRTAIDAPSAMSTVAKQLGLSERQLRRAFRELEVDYGMTTAGWREYVSDARLTWAQQLLSVPGLSMMRIAALSGFGSSVAFSHALSLRTGATPGELARTLRERWG